MVGQSNAMVIGRSTPKVIERSDEMLTAICEVRPQLISGHESVTLSPR
jgi:hypothetical protein